MVMYAELKCKEDRDHLTLVKPTEPTAMTNMNILMSQATNLVTSWCVWVFFFIQACSSASLEPALEPFLCVWTDKELAPGQKDQFRRSADTFRKH